MTSYSLLSMLACVGAIGAVRLFPETQRQGAFPVALALLFFWLVEESAYPPFDWANPVRIFWAFGWKVRSEGLWPVYDGALGAIAFLSALSFWGGDRRAWWGPAIWALCLWSILIHGAYQAAGAWSFDEYDHRLQAPFWARLAVFYAIAIKGVADHVDSWARAALRGRSWGWTLRAGATCSRKVRAPR
ncbi:hypothetical protein ABIC65_001104 [Sphingomonas trueperi]|uniref:hypothetical protein n=1 Tax=Sphingomonas trueperi TaxID=53317 RepID=UPI003393B80D